MVKQDALFLYFQAGYITPVFSNRINYSYIFKQVQTDILAYFYISNRLHKSPIFTQDKFYMYVSRQDIYYSYLLIRNILLLFSNRIYSNVTKYNFVYDGLQDHKTTSGNIDTSRLVYIMKPGKLYAPMKDITKHSYLLPS